MDFNSILGVLIRFVHIASVAALIGGAVYARLVLTPVLNELPETARMEAAKSAQVKFRGWLFVLLILILFSGLYQLLAGPKHGSQYQIWFGIKMLLVLHIFATSILWATSPYGDSAVEGKGKRRLASLCISGIAAILVAAVLHYLSGLGM